MPSLTIDAGVIAAPAPGTPRDLVLRYVESLLNWRQLLEEPRWAQIYVSGRTSEVLSQEELYPLRNHLKPLFASAGIFEYDFNTVARVAEALLGLTPTFEEHFQVDDVEFTELSVIPNLIGTHTLPALVENLSRCAVLIAVLQSHCPHCVVNHAFAVKPWEGPVIVQVQARIREILHAREDLVDFPRAPTYFKGSLRLCQTFREWVLAIDEAAVWRGAQSQDDLQVAVQVALYKSRLQRELDPEWEENPSFSLGSQLFATAQQTGTMTVPGRAERTLGAIVDTIEDLNLRQTHPLRTGKGGNNPQRTKGSAKAWRRDIDYEYHLHYWKCRDDSVEFGSVVTHNDFSIPNPGQGC